MLNFLFKQTDRNTAPPRRIETAPTAQVPIADSTSSSPSIPDIFSSPLIPLSWRSNDMPALQPLRMACGPSQSPPKYVEINLPKPKHRYLFVGDGAAVGGRGESG